MLLTHFSLMFKYLILFNVQCNHYNSEHFSCLQYFKDILP